MPIKKKSKKTAFEKLSLEKKVSAISDALEANVYSALALHGGGVEIDDVKGLTVYIKYYGSCVGCSMAETSTLFFIENVLKESVDPRIKVKIA